MEEMLATEPLHIPRSVAAFDAATEERLLRRYHHDGDVLARDEVIRRCVPLAFRLAARYRAGSPLEDMRQVAAIGLIKAVDGFDPDRGIPFAAYAVPTIIGELKHHVRDHAWAVHVPRSLKERAVDIERATRRLGARLGHAPGIAELSTELRLDREEIVDAIAARSALGAESLDARRFGDGSLTYAEAVGAEDPGFEFDHAPGLRRTLRSLPEQERMILHLRFHHDLSQAEIAERVGVSQMQVSRLLRRSLGRLRPAVERPAA
jgi:RNA polymerase sigma-B factor